MKTLHEEKFFRKSIQFFKTEKIVVLFFLAYFLLGCLIFRDYGSGWDELFQNGIGWVNIAYVLGGNPYLQSIGDFTKYYGPIYEIFVFGLGMIFGIFRLSGHPLAYGSPTQIGIFFRHFMDFLAFFVGTIFFYALCKKYIKSKSLAILGTTFLILSPRIFADSFYNSKDTVFLAFFIIAMYFLVRFLENKTVENALLLSVVSAIAIDVRVLAVLIPFFAYAVSFTDLCFVKSDRKKIRKIIFALCIYSIVTTCLVVAMMPYLWPNPLGNFLNIWYVFAHYPQAIPDLYMGKYVLATNLPWHYIPVWIAITTPPLYIVLFVIGVCYLSFKTRNIKAFYMQDRESILYLLWFFLPLAMVILLHSNLYNAWRQMFFIYPAFILIAMQGVSLFKNATQNNKVASVILTISLIGGVFYIAWTMIAIHPYENLYFNIFAGNNMNQIKKNFETDYWGLSYKKGLEYIVKNDKRKRISIAAENDPAQTNSLSLPDNERKRLYYFGGPKDIQNVDYYLTDFFGSRKELPYKEFYSVKVGGAKIMTVYKIQ